MKQKILQAITALLLIISMTMVNFVFLCANTISYATDIINQEKSTNHKNVQFMAYFKDDNGNKISNKEVYANSENLKLYFQISVKQEGYFNGNIVLKDANFKFRSENNQISVEQINAGETKEVEVDIELLRDEKYNLDNINKESKVVVEGIYKDRTQKDINITGERHVGLSIVNPYKTAEDVILSQNIITNKIIKYDGEEKRIIQISVSSGLKNNLYPIKKTELEIQTPLISNVYAENVLLNTNVDLSTNGKKIVDNNWNYNKESGLLKIEIENKEEEGKIFWANNKIDNFIITYIFAKDVEIKEEKTIVKSNINMIDGTDLSVNNEVKLNNEELDGIVKTETINNEQRISKGKLYNQIARDITSKKIIDINLNKMEKDVEIKENENVEEKELNITYKATKINKDNLQNVLGQKGKLVIIDENTQNQISIVNKETEADKEGNIIIQYPAGISNVTLKISSNENIGRLEVENTKTINPIKENVVKTISQIYGIELVEPETKVDLQLNRTDFSAMTTNNVEMRVVLRSREENDALFKNPTIDIVLPEKFEKININSIDLVYENELKIKSANVNGKVISIALEGKQTSYKEQAIEGAMLIINADLSTSKKTASSKEEIKLSYANNNSYGNNNNGEISKEINIVSYAGIITTTQIPGYGVEVINNDGNKQGVLEIASDKKEIAVEEEIINNKENKISNVKILGVYPTKSEKDSNTINTEVTEIAVSDINQEKYKVYYTNNENADYDLAKQENNWKTNIENKADVKKYLVVIDELDLLEQVKLSYITTIPQGLEYNQNANMKYDVFYNNMTAEEKIINDNIVLSTPKGAVLETTLKTLVSGKESNAIKEDEVLRYQLKIENTGSEDIKDVNIKSDIPEGTTFVNSENLKTVADVEKIEFEDNNKKTVEFNIENIAQGESVEKYYEVKVNKGMANKEISNIAETKYAQVLKQSNSVNTLVSKGGLELKLVSTDTEDSKLKSGFSYRYILSAKNNTANEMKNIKTTVNTSDNLVISEMYYDEEESVRNSNVITINSIKPGETKEILIYAMVKPFTDNQSKPVSISAVCNMKNDDYNSNELTFNATSDLLFDFDVISENSGKYVKIGDTLKYNITIKNNGTEEQDVDLKSWISKYVSIVRVIKNKQEVYDENLEEVFDEEKNIKSFNIEEITVKPGETVEYEIDAIVDMLHGNKKAIQIVSEFAIEVASYEIDTVKIEHVLAPEKADNSKGSNNNEIEVGKIISGIAWIDENEDGQRQRNEKTLSDVKVKLLNAKTNKFVTDEEGKELEENTTDTGFYSFDDIEKGQYIVVFDYDTTKYGVTTFEKEGISSELNSNVISKKISIDGNDKNVATTEIISIENENIPNVNIGLIISKKYDLQLDKFITKVTTQNKKVVSTEYTDAKLAKHEIDAKQVNNTTAIVEYTIRVTNKGDVSAYVKKIVDYLSADYTFNSELNKDWYQSENEVYCTSLANEEIKPGESREVKLIVIKAMKENNTGLINNTAEIKSSYNEYGLTDINSTEGNKVKNEDDMSSADLIISIKTGQVLMTVGITIISIIVLGIVALIIRSIMKEKWM